MSDTNAPLPADLPDRLAETTQSSAVGEGQPDNGQGVVDRENALRPEHPNLERGDKVNGPQDDADERRVVEPGGIEPQNADQTAGDKDARAARAEEAGRSADHRSAGLVDNAQDDGFRR